MSQNGRALDDAATTMQADKEVVLAAVAEAGLALHCASAALRSDRQVVLAAVRQEGQALQHAAHKIDVQRWEHWAPALRPVDRQVGVERFHLPRQECGQALSNL